jgi:hypothetical protein
MSTGATIPLPFTLRRTYESLGVCAERVSVASWYGRLSLFACEEMRAENEVVISVAN